MVGGIVAVAAAGIASALVIASDDEAPVNQVVVAPQANDDEVVELDIHGIPTWWSGRAPRP